MSDTSTKQADKCPKCEERAGEIRCLRTGIAAFQRQQDAWRKTSRQLSQANERVGELEAVVEKLPKYADTGESFVPGVDDAFVVHERGSVNDKEFNHWPPRVAPICAAGFWDGEWRWIIHARYVPYASPAYSTPEAAEQARKESQ